MSSSSRQQRLKQGRTVHHAAAAAGDDQGRPVCLVDVYFRVQRVEWKLVRCSANLIQLGRSVKVVRGSEGTHE